MADWLAKQGAKGSTEKLLTTHRVPREIKGIMRLDDIGLPVTYIVKEVTVNRKRVYSYL